MQTCSRFLGDRITVFHGLAGHGPTIYNKKSTIRTTIFVLKDYGSTKVSDLL